MDTDTRQIHNFKAGDKFHEHYRLLEHVGSGGFADVWRAEDTLVDTIVALKIYTRLDKEGISELAKEYKEMRGIKHPNLLTGNHFDASGNIPYLEMDYCDGGSLYGKMGKMTIDELRHVLRDIAGGLAYLHKEGIVHQDIKPENILYDSKHDLFLLSDFGISSKSRTRLSKSVNMASDIVSMTKAYAPPEKFSSNPADRMPDTKGDIFSFGITLYELATSVLPFDQPVNTGDRMLEKAGNVEIYFDNISDPQLRGIVERCVSYRKGDRPTAEEVLAILDGKETKPEEEPEQEKPAGGTETVRVKVNGGGVQKPEPPKPPKPSKPDSKWMYIAVAVAAALLVVLLVALLRSWPIQEVEDSVAVDTIPIAVPESSAKAEPAPEQKTGTLYITSTPMGAAVKVDGKYKGDTPLTLEELNPGKYEVTISADGYETSTQTAKVTVGKTANCRADLRKKQAEEQQPTRQPEKNHQQPQSSTNKAAQGVKIIHKTDKDFRKFDIIAGYYIKTESAIKAALNIRSMGLESYIIEIDNDAYYVGVGSADNRSAIESLYDNIKKHYEGDIVIKEW